jgi:hypothetical protein
MTMQKKILDNEKINIDGMNLLKTIHFLTEAELVPPTPENITKTYLSDIKKYYEIKPEIDKALNILVDAKILIVANNIYKITSDLETKLLDEMNEFIIELFIKKRNLINHIKKSKTLKNISSVSDNNMQYLFNVLSDLDDEIFPSSNKNLEIRLHSLYSINEDREEFIETVKLDTQYEKRTIPFIPQNINFKKIDSLLEEIQRYTYMQEKYGNDPDANVKQIIREFALIKEEKEKELKGLIEDARRSIEWIITRLVKAGARIVYHARRLHVHVASAFPLGHHYRVVIGWQCRGSGHCKISCKDLVREVFSKRTKKLDSSRFWSGMMVFWAFPKQISTLKRENLTENRQMGMRNWFLGKVPHNSDYCLNEVGNATL